VVGALAETVNSPVFALYVSSNGAAAAVDVALEGVVIEGVVVEGVAIEGVVAGENENSPVLGLTCSVNSLTRTSKGEEGEDVGVSTVVELLAAMAAVSNASGCGFFL
jgi:hypothetical protein